MAAKTTKKISKSLWFFSLVLPVGYVAFLMHIASLAPQYRAPTAADNRIPKSEQFTFYKQLPSKDLGDTPVLTLKQNQEQKPRELRDPTRPAYMNKSIANNNKNSTSTNLQKNPLAQNATELSRQPQDSLQEDDFSKQVKQQFSKRVLQVGSYRDWKEADRKRAELALLGLTANIETTQINNQKTYRVNLGPFNQDQEFKNAQQTLSLYDIPSSTRTQENKR